MGHDVVEFPGDLGSLVGQGPADLRFLLSDHRILEEFGFGLGFSVLIDALVIRSLLLPALMHLTGPANWFLPGWLDGLLPRLPAEPDQAAVPAVEGSGPVAAR